jgi:Cu-Zn family superoxide dismutase
MKNIIALSVVVALGGCALQLAGPSAKVEMQATKGNAATGTLQLLQKGDKVLVRGQIAGLRANGEHGFHLHEKGDCSSGDGMGTGGHFNPTSQSHGMHGHGEIHAGDMPALKANANGVAVVDFETSSISLLDGNPTNAVGRGLIIHRDADDFKTQPTGNSGPRISCGVVTK